MNNHDFWESVRKIIADGFTPEGLDKLEKYAELFSTRRLIFKRFSPQEQYGCTAGGSANVIATILAGAENSADSESEAVSDFKREFKRAAQQAENIEKWAISTGCWIKDVDKFLSDRFGELISEGGEAKVYDNGISLIKSIGLDYYILPCYALDRISLHNTFFPETCLQVIGFGRDVNDEFKIIVEQPFVEGSYLTEEEIETYVISLGFELKNRRNWTYSTPYVYLSDMHDENVIKSTDGIVYVLDCDIRINTPELRQGGIRTYNNDVEFV